MQRQVENFSRHNRVNVVGELVEVDLKTGHSQSSGKEYISGDLQIKSIIDGREQVTTVSLMTMALKNDGTPNSFFANYQKLDELIGKRVQVSGEIDENRFFAERDSQLISYNRIRGVFVNEARANDQDQATFEFSGFIYQPLTEIMDQEGELIGYDILLAQGNYNQSKMIVARLSVQNEKIAEAIRGLYQTYDTVKFTGNYLVETETEEHVEETAFGEPIVSTRTKTRRSFVITSGSNPIEVGAYTDEKIRELNAEYVADGQAIEEKAKDSAFSEQKESTTAKSGLGRTLL